MGTEAPIWTSNAEIVRLFHLESLFSHLPWVSRNNRGVPFHYARTGEFLIPQYISLASRWKSKNNRSVRWLHTYRRKFPKTPYVSLPPTTTLKKKRSDRWLYKYPVEIHKSSYVSLPPSWKGKNNRGVRYMGSIKCQWDSPIVRRFLHELQENDGFDITPFPRSPRSTILSVIPSPWLLWKHDDVEMLKKHAKNALGHLESTKDKWEVEKIVKVNIGTCCEFAYYITFTAKPNDGGQPCTFEAKVKKCHGREVTYPIIRLKPEKEKKEPQETYVDSTFLSNLSLYQPNSA